MQNRFSSLTINIKQLVLSIAQRGLLRLRFFYEEVDLCDGDT